MAMIRNDFTEQVLKDALETFETNYAAVPEVWTALFQERNVTKPYVAASSSVGVGDLEQVEEGRPLPYDQPTKGWTVHGRVRTFGKAAAFSDELYEDTQVHGLFLDLVSQIAETYPRTRDRFYAAFFNNGALTAGHDVFDASIPGVVDDPTGGFIYDGKPFFADAANAHPLKASAATIQNYFGLPLTYENLLTVHEHMNTSNNVDEMGNPIVLRPDTLLVPPALETEALKIIGAEWIPHETGTSTVRNPLFNKFTVIVWHHLTDRDGWFLLERKKGLRALNRRNLTIDFYYDSETRQYKGNVTCRFGGYVDNCRYTTACNTAQA